MVNVSIAFGFWKREEFKLYDVRMLQETLARARRMNIDFFNVSNLFIHHFAVISLITRLNWCLYFSLRTIYILVYCRKYNLPTT